MPNARVRVQGPNGGYLVRTNHAGFRSEREFTVARNEGKFRALLFGDSQTAGDGIPNGMRFSDLLEAALPGLEVNNHGISGTATDQQYLTFQEHASTEHDLVILGLYVENILRVTRRVVKTRDAKGLELFREKPYFEFADGRLSLRNVPVPKKPWTAEMLPEDLRGHVYAHGEANFFFRDHSSRHATVMRLLSHLGPVRQLGKWALTRMRKFQPLPGYDSPTHPEWLLLREILKTWIATSRTPVLIVLLPLDSFLFRLSDPTPYQTRFRELSLETGCQLYDPLPELLKMPASERRALWSDAYGHLSAQGHSALARLLTPVIRGLMQIGR